MQNIFRTFTLGQTKEFLETQGFNWSDYDIVECYMIMGGIPYYLSLLENDLSYAQNIDNLFFRKKAELWDEFEHLYRTLFKNSDKYIEIVECLSSKHRGCTRNEISEFTQIDANGKLTRMLEDLVNSGFVKISSFYGNKKKDALYQLSDYYTNFYFKFLKDNHGKDENYWSKAIENPSRRSWTGYTFEQVCKRSYPTNKNEIRCIWCFDKRIYMVFKRKRRFRSSWCTNRFVNRETRSHN